ncbi:unnamed protein product [Acanthoscelides obtectus]|uniref:Uncharacterized protein n=1 Tax=Acanthoscelides obtectus TaxID=200917 RepID=A0A9P0QGD0_ACAOB|nr:unnamed protein product [Acanthoscelides obtectus]CAK1689436.1 hypothetical protein AOBTE_LOCUS37261 [Acanthoscelides obtectus]
MQAPKKKDRRTQEEMVLRDLLEDCVRGALGFSPIKKKEELHVLEKVQIQVKNTEVQCSVGIGSEVVPLTRSSGSSIDTSSSCDNLSATRFPLRYSLGEKEPRVGTTGG